MISLSLTTFRAAVCLCALLFAFSACAYDEPQAVRLRFPDLSLAFDTPSFAPGKTDFTSYEEMMAFVERLTENSDSVTLRIIGESQEGRSIPMLVLTNSRATSAADVQRLNRPIVWLQGLQHGDEPAGGEAMLAIANALAVGELKPLLDRLTVVIIPRANPDGAARFTRRTANSIDVNRDHIKFDLPETVALHRAMNEYQPQVLVDCHEFSVHNRWLQKWNLINAYDVTLLYATNANVPPELTALADELYRARATAALEQAGLRHYWYFTTSYDVADKRVQMGGLAPDIARNTFGLAGSISFLMETRGVGIGREHYERRVAAHYIALKSMLETTADNAARVQATVSAARSRIAEAKADPIIVTSQPRKGQRDLAMLDPVSGEDRTLTVAFEDTLQPVPGIVRARPYAYLLPPSYRDLARKLSLNGVRVQTLRRPTSLDVDAYAIVDKKVATTTEEGHVHVTVATETSSKNVRFPAGSYVVTMLQPNALLAAVALEPESASSFVAIGLIPVDKRGSVEGSPSEVPVYRLMAPARLPLAIAEF